MSFLNLFGCSKPNQRAEPKAAPELPSLKTINYREGLVRFSIPSNWLEEYEPGGGGTFYENRPDSGTLRLSVLSFEGPAKTAEEITLTAFPQDVGERLPNGLRLHHFIKSANENGEALELHHWNIAVPVPPHRLRMVCFSYTMLEGQQVDPKIATELKMLDESIRTAEFSQQL